MAASAALQHAIAVRLVRTTGEAIDAFDSLEGEPLSNTANVKDVKVRLKVDRGFFIGNVPTSGLSVYGPFARKPCDDQIKDLIRGAPLEYDAVLSSLTGYDAELTNYFLVCVPLPTLPQAAGASLCPALRLCVLMAMCTQCAVTAR